MTYITVDQNCKRPSHGDCSLWWVRCSCGYEQEATSSAGARHLAQRHAKGEHR